MVRMSAHTAPGGRPMRFQEIKLVSPLESEGIGAISRYFGQQ